jgi:hypothetical protein
MTPLKLSPWIVLAVVVAGCSKESAGNDPAASERFSFFVTSLRALQDLSGSQSGFGGDLRFGETGAGAGLRGADRICAAIAERSLPGSGAKTWRAFLSAADDGTGSPVHAVDRVGAGPWYDRLGRVFALSKEGLLNERPEGCDEATAYDFPNEDGVPNHAPDPNAGQVDNHDMLTGTNDKGQLYAATATCLDWTSSSPDVALTGRPRVGHSWTRNGTTPNGTVQPPDGGPTRLGEGGAPPCPEGGGPCSLGTNGPPVSGAGPCGNRTAGGGSGGESARGDGPPMEGGSGGAPPTDGFVCGPGGNLDGWMSSLDESGCAPGINLIEMGPPNPNASTVGSGGGYGGFYCFALTP